jgi:hypothetical protein
VGKVTFNVAACVEFTETLIAMKYPFWIFEQVMTGFVVTLNLSEIEEQMVGPELKQRSEERYWNGLISQAKLSLTSQP